MFKTLIALGRSRTHDLTRSVRGRGAASVPPVQTPDGAEGGQAARQALAMALDQAGCQRRWLARITAQIDDLETRSLGALAIDRNDLAGEGAAAIARLEAARRAVQAALTAVNARIAGLRHEVQEAGRHLSDQDRLGHPTERLFKNQELHGVSNHGPNALARDAGPGLTRLQQCRQIGARAPRALSVMTACQSAETVSHRLATEGCGPALETDVRAMLARLRSQQA